MKSQSIPYIAFYFCIYAFFTLLLGILFQLIVFILIFGVGISCCGSFSITTSGSIVWDTGVVVFCIGGGGNGAGGAWGGNGMVGGGGGGGAAGPWKKRRKLELTFIKHLFFMFT